MRKIISVRRNRNDTQMWYVVHDSVQKLYEVWHVDPEDPTTVRPDAPYGYGFVSDEKSARLLAMNRARDLADAS